MFNHINCTNCCFLYPKMAPLYLNTLYLHQERVLSMEATIFVTVAQTGQTKHLWVVMTLKATTGSVSCLEWEGEMRGIQLQHAPSPPDVTKAQTKLCSLTSKQMNHEPAFASCSKVIWNLHYEKHLNFTDYAKQDPDFQKREKKITVY